MWNNSTNVGKNQNKLNRTKSNKEPNNEIRNEKEILPELEIKEWLKLKKQKTQTNKKNKSKANSKLNNTSLKKNGNKNKNIINTKRKRYNTCNTKDPDFKKFNELSQSLNENIDNNYIKCNDMENPEIDSIFNDNEGKEYNFKLKKCNNLKECDFLKYLNKIKEEKKQNFDDFNINQKSIFNIKKDKIDEIIKISKDENSINNKISINPNKNNEQKDNINTNIASIKEIGKIDIKKESNDNSKNDLNELNQNININDAYNNNNRERESNSNAENSHNDSDDENIFKKIEKNKEEEDDYEDYDRLLNIRRMTRSRTSLNFTFLPKYFSVLKNSNIFNLLLIMLNNISDINDYITNISEETIINYDKNNLNCLTFIIYYFSKYLWRASGFDKITEEDLLKRYTNFINIYLKHNCGEQNKNNYFYDKNNVELIFTFIFHKINGELSKNNFNKEKNLILLQNFYGIMKYQIQCDYCQSRIYNYNYEFSYISFYRITFNINEINNYYLNNMNNICNMDNSLNLSQCFDYIFIKKYRITSNPYSYCNSCNLNGFKSMYILINDAPKILALILLNNDRNCNLIMRDELNLNKYMVNSSDKDRRYLLISVLCQIKQNGKYICYSINQNDGHWYSYSDERIEKVFKIDTNTVLPLVLFYQKRNTLTFECNNISLDTNMIFLKIKISQFSPVELLFNRNSTIKNVVNQILLHFKLTEKKGRLLINGESTDEKEVLSKYLQQSNDVTLIIK